MSGEFMAVSALVEVSLVSYLILLIRVRRLVEGTWQSENWLSEQALSVSLCVIHIPRTMELLNVSPSSEFLCPH